MITNYQELAASLHYVQRWADALEAMRMDAESEADSKALLPTTSAGPLNEIRRVVGEACEFVDGLQVGQVLEAATATGLRHNKAA